jgi:histidinol-phosphatase (PHP family)
MIDYHNHTKLCKHAEGEVYQYVEKAISLGIKEMAFTDHMPLPNDFDIAHRMSEKEMDIYVEWVSNAKSRYPEIKILFGIEADYYEGFEEYTEKYLNQYDFDLVIMSIHFMKNWPQGNWVFKYDFPERSYKDIYIEYLQAIMNGLKTRLYDVVGHLDIIKTPGQSMSNLVPSELSKVMKEIKKQDMVLEINSSGFRKKVEEPYPELSMLDIIRENDVAICVGSDSHAPDQVGLKFELIYDILRQKGFEFLTHFEKRNQIVKPINNNIQIGQ